MKKLLILGGNGFIGRNLANYALRQNYDVFSFDIKSPTNPCKDITYINGNFFNDDDLKMAVHGMDCVIHAVCTITPANSVEKFYHGYKNDFLQSIKLFEYIVKENKQLIFLSSGGTIYGSQSDVPIQEDSKLLPINHYGNIKLCIESVMRVMNQHSLSKCLRIARISNPYGPGQNGWNGVGFIDTAIKKALNNEILDIWGNGNTIRDYIYIDDVCRYIFSIFDYKGNYNTFNISTGIGTSQNDVIQIISKYGYNLKCNYLDFRDIDTPMNVLDNSRIIKIAKYKPLKLYDGIGKYINYLKDIQS